MPSGQDPAGRARAAWWSVRWTQPLPDGGTPELCIFLGPLQLLCPAAVCAESGKRKCRILLIQKKGHWVWITMAYGLLLTHAMLDLFQNNFCISLVTDKINEGGGRVRGHFILLVLFFIFIMWKGSGVLTVFRFFVCGAVLFAWRVWTQRHMGCSTHHLFSCFSLVETTKRLLYFYS